MPSRCEKELGAACHAGWAPPRPSPRPKADADTAGDVQVERQKSMPQISLHAIVEDGAELADDVRVGPFSYVGPHVQLGAGCVLDNSATVIGRTSLGANTHVFPLAVVGAPAEAGDAQGRCILGRDNVIREHATIRCGASEASPTRIGDDNLIMIACQIGPGAGVGSHSLFANCTLIEGDTVVADYVRTSAFSAIQSGAGVGAYSFVAGYAVVDHHAPPYAMLQGSPFRVRGVNTRNLGRCGFAEQDISALKDAFRELFDGTGGEPDGEAFRRMTSRQQPNQHVRALLEALQHASAGGGADSD